MLGKKSSMRTASGMYADFLSQLRRLYPKDINVAFATGLPTMFGVPK